jgi:hypothetical protein
MPPLAPAKVLRSDATLPTWRRSSRVSRAAGSTATAVSEGSRGVAAAAGPQQEAKTTEPRQSVAAVEAQQVATAAEPRQVATVTTVTMATSVAAPSTPPAPAAAGSPRAAVVEIPNDDVPPPDWDQWASLPASTPEASVGALVVRHDVGTALGARLMVPGPRRRTSDPRHIRSRSGSVPERRWPTSSRLRRSRGCGRSSVITALRSTGR